jgi:biopolymer transport protein ExbD
MRSVTNMRLSARRGGESPEVNLVSLVDVVLLLLIFFMLTTSFVRQSQLAVHLPEAAAPAQPDAASPPALEITVTARGTYYVNGRALVDSRPETLSAAIRRVAPERGVRDVSISADAAASHQAVVTAMDAVGRLGYTDVHIATVRPRQAAD